jgi:HK97 family phage major capsid protein
MAVNSSQLKGWSPDVQSFLPDDALPDLLLPKVATIVAGAIHGDEPSVRVPYITDDGDSVITAEGAAIAQDDPVRAEVVIQTHKLAKLVVLSRESFEDGATSTLVANSSGRAISSAANAIVVAAIKGTTGIIDGGSVGANLDTISDAMATVATNGAHGSVILVGPAGWSSVRKLKSATDSNLSILGAGTADAAPTIFGSPVIVDNAVGADDLFIVDPSAIAAADGMVEAAVSEERYFELDSVGMRTTYRFGLAVQRANRIAKISLAASAG